MTEPTDQTYALLRPSLFFTVACFAFFSSQELLSKTSATNIEVTELRQMCDALQRQLNQLGEKPTD